MIDRAVKDEPVKYDAGLEKMGRIAGIRTFGLRCGISIRSGTVRGHALFCGCRRERDRHRAVGPDLAVLFTAHMERALTAASAVLFAFFDESAERQYPQRESR